MYIIHLYTWSIYVYTQYRGYVLYNELLYVPKNQWHISSVYVQQKLWQSWPTYNCTWALHGKWCKSSFASHVRVSISKRKLDSKDYWRIHSKRQDKRQVHHPIIINITYSNGPITSTSADKTEILKSKFSVLSSQRTPPPLLLMCINEYESAHTVKWKWPDWVLFR